MPITPGESEVQDHPQLHRAFEVSCATWDSLSKIKKRKKSNKLKSCMLRPWRGRRLLKCQVLLHSSYSSGPGRAQTTVGHRKDRMDTCRKGTSSTVFKQTSTITLFEKCLKSWLRSPQLWSPVPHTHHVRHWQAAGNWWGSRWVNKKS